MSETLSGFCVPHTEEDLHTRVGGRGPPSSWGVHCYSIHSSLLLLTTATTIIIIKEVLCTQIREATWGGKIDVLNGIGKTGLNLFIFVLLQSSEANTLKRMAHCPLGCKGRVNIN